MSATNCGPAARNAALLLKASVAAILLAALAVSAAAQGTEWRRDPATSGSWITAANWTGGVPTTGYYVTVANGGTAIISGTAAKARQLTIENNSTVQQDGVSLTLSGGATTPDLYVNSGSYRLNSGTLTASNSNISVANYGQATFHQETGKVSASGTSIYVGCKENSRGTWELVGSGTLTCKDLTLGSYGQGYFNQSAGAVTADQLWMASQSPWSGLRAYGEYNMSGGTLTVREALMGFDGSALFHQTAGTATFTEHLTIGAGVDVGPRQYELLGGIVNSGQVDVGPYSTGEFNQSGGTHNAGYVNICPGGVYRYTGGVLNVQGGLCLAGSLDFGGQARTLTFTNSVVEFGPGQLLGAAQTTIAADNHTLIILPAGLDSASAFAAFSPNALVQRAGATVVIPTDRSIGGWGQINEHVQCSGALTAPSNGFLDLNAGVTIDNNSTVELRTGQVIVADTSSGLNTGRLNAGTMAIGSKATGSFTQSQGTVALTGDLELGYERAGDGTYTLGHGQLTAAREFIGYQGHGQVIQSGGSNSVSGDLLMGQMTYSQGSYSLSGDGSLSAANESLGYLGSGLATFSQTGGTNTVTGKLVIGTDHRPTIGGYTLDQGSLHTAKTVLGTTGSGYFTQSGGTHTVTDTLAVGYATNSFNVQCYGKYTMTGGTLAVANLKVGGTGSKNGSGGVFEILGPTDIQVSNSIYFGRVTTLNAVAGSAILLTGSATFDNECIDPLAMSGLGNLRLTVNSGPSVIGQLEVSSRDWGELTTGFSANFALGALEVGTTGPSALKLVDARDNQPSWTGREALYVHMLTLAAGSTLDLNGLNLYCENYANSGGTINLNGGHLEVVPEPATLSLLAIGLAGLVARRRKS